MAVYPNPTTGIVNVSLPAASSQSFEVFNMAGHLLMKIPAENESVTQVELPEQVGLYLLKIQTDSDVIFRKVIKK